MAVYKIDTHIHTSESSYCSELSALEIVNVYKDFGYSTLIITDHFNSYFFEHFPDLSWEEKISKYLVGYRLAKAEGLRKGISVLLGLEIRFTDCPNDYLVYGLDEEFLYEHQDLCKAGLKEFRKLLVGKRVKIYQAHPFRAGMRLVNPKLLDGIEVYNGNGWHDSRNELAKEYAKEHGLLMISGSDTHATPHVATGGIRSKTEITNNDELLAFLESSDLSLLENHSQITC